MKRFNVCTNGGTFINIQATRMELNDNMILAWDGAELVACVDIGTVVTAHISEKGDPYEKKSPI